MDSTALVAFTIVCDSPDFPSIFALESHEHLTISSFATVIGDRMEPLRGPKVRTGATSVLTASHMGTRKGGAGGAGGGGPAGYVNGYNVPSWATRV